MSACVFCQIVAGTVPATLLHDDTQVVAFADRHPQAPFHAVLIPKTHLVSMRDVRQADEGLMGHLMHCARQLAQQHGYDSQGYRLVVNCGLAGGQTVDHLHVHLLAGRAMAWPPG